MALVAERERLQRFLASLGVMLTVAWWSRRDLRGAALRGWRDSELDALSHALRVRAALLELPFAARLLMN